MGLGKNWTEKERRIIRSGYDDPDIKIMDIAEVLGRSRWGVVSEAKRMGLLKATTEVTPP